MFVLTDIEWVTNENGHKSPTQLAAVRVDENWNCVDKFESYIKPRDSSFCDWDQVAFTGGSSYDFQYAPSADTVLISFLNWLNSDDVILWWHKDSEKLFKMLVGIILKVKVHYRMVSIRNYVYEQLSGQFCPRGSAYSIAEARGIKTNPSMKHCSANDVRVMRELLAEIKFPQPLLLKPLVPAQKPKAAVQNTSLPYQYDPESNTFHQRSCELITTGSLNTVGYLKVISALNKGYKLCSCCRESFRSALRERNTDTIERSGYTFLFSPESKAFHRRSCHVMLYAKSILGTKKYETAAQTGRTPCKICCPDPSDVSKPLPRQYQNKLVTPVLSSEDRKAIIRQKQAIKERRRLLNNGSLTETERNDIYTLTQPRFAFWASQGYMTFHLRSCTKLAGLTNLKGFQYFNDAIHAGYTPCRKCRPSPKNNAEVSIPINNKLRSDEIIEDIEPLCSNAGYNYFYDGAYFCIDTPVGRWKINISTVPVKLMHINLVMTPDSIVYHKQPRIFLSYTDTFNYIKRHDDELMQKKLQGKAFPVLL